jgi:hypothetical protein
MGESMTVPKKQLAFDTDWRSATAMVALFALCALFGTNRLVKIVHGAPPGIAVTWQTWLQSAVFAMGAVAQSPRWFRAVSLILALSFASRILLHLLNARVETQLANAALLRVVDLILWAGGCAGVLWWFRSKLRYV